MTSEKQIEANRRNAQKSTGAKTDEGKEKSKMNALKHGLTAEAHVLPGESSEEFQRFVAAVVEHLTPLGPLEITLAQRIGLNLWRLMRVGRAEIGLYAVGMIDADSFGPSQIDIYRLKTGEALPVDEGALRLGDAFSRVTLNRGNGFLQLSRYEAHILRMLEADLKWFDKLRKLVPPIKEFGIEGSIFEELSASEQKSDYEE